MKYNIGGLQGQYQAGSNKQVLANKLDIIETADMDEAEFILLEKLYREVLVNNLPLNSIKIADIKNWHRRWLGNIYECAGEERSVNLTKDDFQFATASQIPRLLEKFEDDYLNRLTPCNHFNREQLIEAIAIIHIEFILIHPFREGNGRLSRLLANVMAVQAGLSPLDYTCWDQNKAEYIASIQQGVAMNYEPIKYWVSKIIKS